MGYEERPGDVARLWYSRRREDDQVEQGYWYFDTVLEARVVRDRLLDDATVVETGIEVKSNGNFKALENPNRRLKQDPETLEGSLEGRTTPEETREGSTVVAPRNRTLVFAIPGVLAGMAVAAVVLIILLRRRERRRRAEKAAQTLKFDSPFWTDRAFWRLVLEAILTSR